MDGLLEQGKTKWTQNNEGQLGKPDERGAFWGMLCWYLAKLGKAIRKRESATFFLRKTKSS